MNDFQLTAVLVALTTLVRDSDARIPSRFAPPLAMVYGAVLGVMAAETISVEAALHGVFLALVGVGIMTAFGYAGTRLGEALAKDREARAREGAPAPHDATEPGART